MTQIMGGYLSDRLGGDKVLMSAATGWALITFWTPQIIHLFSDKSLAFTVIIISRIMLGCFQGKLAQSFLICQIVHGVN